MTPSMPPVPPNIAAQQQSSPLMQFAQGGAGGQMGQPGPPPPEQLLQSLVDQTGQLLTKIAVITGQLKPELIPILKQAVSALSMFADKIKVNDQGSPDGGSQGDGSDNAPDAAGGSAMGMPQ